MSRKPVRIGFVLAALVGVFLAGMSASQGADPAPTRTPRSAQSSSFDSAAELLFRPITPCRAVDTRVAGGAFAGGGATRTESMVTGLGAQGGNNANCGVPATAQAVTASVTVVGTGGAGDLKIYPANAAVPNASAMAWNSAGLVTTTGVNVTLSSGNVKITANGASTHVVVDITGYYVEQISANVTLDAGFYDRSNRVLSIARVGMAPVGAYRITLDRQVDACSAVASAYGQDYTMRVDNNNNIVDVYAYNTAGTLVDTDFQLTVTC